MIRVKSKNSIIINKLNEPISPVLDENTAKIKSVCISGKYIGVLFSPYPIRPPLPIAVIPFSNWYPLPLDQSSNLSTLRKKDEPNILINKSLLIKYIIKLIVLFIVNKI